MLATGIILCAIAIICFIVGLVGHLKQSDKPWIFLTFLIMLVIPGIALIHDAENPIPHEQDVLDGKALYEEILHIRSNDTIKTYEIVWKDNK